jgi:hypothetical protein
LILTNTTVIQQAYQAQPDVLPPDDDFMQSGIIIPRVLCMNQELTTFQAMSATDFTEDEDEEMVTPLAA